MKRIVKRLEPDEFRQWKDQWRSIGIEPGWDEFDGKPIKQTVKQSLLSEQGSICCFCETGVDMTSGHIEHLFDQKGHPDRVLDYDNFLYSCQENPGTFPNTCGHAQKNRVLPVSPLDETCETRFRYREDGSIHPHTPSDVEAFETIRVLNLNGSKRLCESRREVYEETCDNKGDLSPDEFAQWIANELNPQPDGTFKPYWTTRKYATGLYDYRPSTMLRQTRLSP